MDGLWVTCSRSKKVVEEGEREYIYLNMAFLSTYAENANTQSGWVSSHFLHIVESNPFEALAQPTVSTKSSSHALHHYRSCDVVLIICLETLHELQAQHLVVYVVSAINCTSTH